MMNLLLQVEGLGLGFRFRFKAYLDLDLVGACSGSPLRALGEARGCAFACPDACVRKHGAVANMDAAEQTR